MAQHILKIWWLQGVGALYLAYLAVAHLFHRQTIQYQDQGKPGIASGFWRTVLAVELTDIAFATDSILVAVALTTHLWIIYTGAAIGIVAMRMVAGAFVKLLYRFPQIENVAYILVGWIAIKLSFATWETFSAAVLGHAYGHHILPAWLFWTVMAAIVVLGGWLSFRHPPGRNLPDNRFPSKDCTFKIH